MSRGPAVRICGGDFAALQERGSCGNSLHNWPLPRGYVDASEMAASRLSIGWSNTRCPECGIYGWAPGRLSGLAAESIEVQP